MTKKLMTMLLAMLALVSCDSKDEPYPEVKVESDMVKIRFIGAFCLPKFRDNLGRLQRIL